MTPRKLAHELLIKAEKSTQYSNITLDNALSKQNFSPADKKLVSIIFYGVTERKLFLDHQISSLSSRTIEDIDINTLTALRMGLYQLIYLDRVPPHAAINESVNLVSKKSAGFVNAILRAFQRKGSPFLPSKDNIEQYISICYSVCQPLASLFLRIFGEAETERFLTAINTANDITLRTNTLLCSRAQLLENIDTSKPTENSSSGVYAKGSVRDLYGFDEGYFFVQDEASQIAVEALGLKENDTVVDLCSCPGSKSFGAAIEMKNKGKIYSFDLHENKLSLVINGADRLKINIIETAAADARINISKFNGIADKVICDVPCSGFGVLSKKPELRYKDPSASASLPKIQSDILDNACHYVKKSGILLYSTCTVLPTENEDNISAFLKRHPEFSLLPWKVGNIEAKSGMITLLPHVHSTDGFFIAKLIKN